MVEHQLQVRNMAMSIFACLLVSAAPARAAEPTGHDFFGHNLPAPPKPNPQAGPNLGAGSLAMMSKLTPATAWFENFDRTRYMQSPSKMDASILQRPFNQEAERVQEWTQVANKVSKNYRLLASIIRAMDVPPNHPGLKDYKDLTADWYADMAGVYEDLIRPRAPARTMEELEAQLNSVREHSVSLAHQGKTLHAMDLDLRKQYKVHVSEQSDALQQYVKAK